MSESGATAAYRGYRLQAYYVLSRVLKEGEAETNVFHPEGSEDLNIENANGDLLEAIQVKSYGNLVLSNLSPEKSGSFFHRALDLLKTNEHTSITLVNFGHFGTEIDEAWKTEGEHRDRVSQKLHEFGYKAEEIELLFNHIQLVELSEETVRTEVFSKLQEQIVGIDPANAFELLLYWLYLQSETRTRIKYTDLIEKLLSVGKFLSERYQHLQEWFKSIHPIDDRLISAEEGKSLQDEFYRGVSARYEHILADLDFHREQKLVEIEAGFAKKNVVIVHAASGQGKTTLAYRFLHDKFPNNWRVSVIAIEDLQHALSIATALSGHANAIQAPMAVYIDVSPRDANWVDLVGQLSRHPFLKLLVTIREEDFRRANIANLFDYEPVDLEFNKEEAHLIFNRAQEASLLSDILTFEDAWHSFGEDGPLMEFVYLLTQTETLHQRLEGQITRLRHEVREKNLSPDELHLLRLVSIATAYDARLNTAALVGLVNLPESGLTLKLYEKEYLLRISPDRTFITGVHPIRSTILSNLLSEPDVTPWEASVRQVLPIIQEQDWEAFILQAFLEHPESFKELLDIVINQKPRSWTGYTGIIRCLLWAGAKKYIEDNWDQVEASRILFGPAWHFIMDLNFAGEEAPSIEGWWNNLGDLIPDEKRTEIEKIRKSQTPKANVFEMAISFINNTNEQPLPPITVQDWTALPETLYWAYRFDLSEKFLEWIPIEQLKSAINDLSLKVLSEIFLGIYLSAPDKYFMIVDEVRLAIENRLAQELDIISLVEKDDVLSIHFLTFPDEKGFEVGNKQKEYSVHDRTIERIQIVRQIFPHFSKYGSQGYGHQIPEIGVEHDDSTKNGIEKKQLVPKWPIRLNGITTGIVQYYLRIEKWADYFHQILTIRQQVVDCLSPLPDGIVHFISRDKPYNLISLDMIQNGDWDKSKRAINNIPLLPKPAADPWGLAQPEGKSIEEQNEKLNSLERLFPSSILEQIYKPYLDSERKYFSSMRNFLEQSGQVMVTNFHTGKLPDDSPQKVAKLEYIEKEGIRTNLGSLSFFNLTEARNNLSNYQKSFRDLFSHRIENDYLSNLELQEMRAMDQLWPLWYFFAIRPRTSVANPRKQLPVKLEIIKQNILRRAKEAVEAIQDEGIRSIVIDEKFEWDDNPSVLILLDVDNTTIIYPKVEETIIILRESIGVVSPSDIEQQLIENGLRYFVIVVTVGGRMINKLVWPLRTIFTLTTHDPIEKKLWAFTPQELPEHMLEKLGLRQWEGEQIEAANQLVSAVSAIVLYLALIEKIEGMPDATEAGAERLKSFLEERSGELSKLLQLFFDSSTLMVNQFNNLSKEEQAERSYLLGAVNLLSEMYESVKPIEKFDGQATLGLEEITIYKERLTQAVQSCEMIRLLWIQDIIERDC
jgi:GTPase SAR1 family protein